LRAGKRKGLKKKDLELLKGMKVEKNFLIWHPSGVSKKISGSILSGVACYQTISRRGNGRVTGKRGKTNNNRGNKIKKVLITNLGKGRRVLKDSNISYACGRKP